MVEKFRAPGGPLLYRTATHSYYAPHPLLRAYIAHYTISYPDEAAAPGAVLTIVPDASGCLTFILREALESFCWGAETKAVSVDAGPAAARMYLFVEFLPGGQRRLTGFPQPDLLDRQVPLALLDRELEDRVYGLLEAAPGPRELTRGLDELFLSRLGRFESLPPALTGLSSLSVSTVREMAEGRCYSRRQLDRIFREGVGMAPKTYLRLLRINRAVRLFGPGVPLARVAQEAGYFDQSHFIRDFRAVCGVTPGTYRENMSVFYNETLKF